MFASAKSDFEPDILESAIEEVGESGRSGIFDIDRQTRQQVFDQVGLVQAQLVALATAEERPMRVPGRTVVG